ncbi:sulfatase-like hydrolase/transferase [Halolamina sp.]|jgi:arylsulfatase A-like enzyme|uniref:sulfatase-like hydrolase/transferase n=1 Tax=Halolamina sp. TaxID=1940283 RepID=UPI0012FD511A
MTDNHVFLITADGLRYDRLSSSGHDVETTPTLDALAAAGAACSRAMVTGTGTRKSFPDILTSSYPLMYGGYAQLTDQRVPTSSVFQSRGYATLGVNANAQLHTRFGWGKGTTCTSTARRRWCKTKSGRSTPTRTVVRPRRCSVIDSSR